MELFKLEINLLGQEGGMPQSTLLKSGPAAPASLYTVTVFVSEGQQTDESVPMIIAAGVRGMLWS